VYARGEQPRVGEELEAQLDWLRAGGWTESPLHFHELPPPMGPMAVANARSAGLDLEVMRYDSEFEPRSGAPGRERWLSYRANRSAEVRLVRHRDSADWLVCVHGLGMGRAFLDLRLLDAQWLHGRGVNLAFPVLPLHGLRRRALVSGTGFVSGDVADTLHALTQAIWDLRRLIAWLRSQGAARVGVYGLSLGGYTSAVLAAVEDDLDFVLAGVPATEMAELMWFHASLRALALAEGHGITPERLSAALLPVAPLVLKPRVPRERRFLFGATADRFVPPRQVEALWRHWECPPMSWYPGAHLGFRLHPQVRAYIARSLDGCDFGRAP
jgi:dienelactone hydrolase